jgi:hypothetical protein
VSVSPLEPDSLTAELVSDGLRFGAGGFVRRWVEELASLGEPPPDLRPAPLEPDDAAALLDRLGVAEVDALDVIATLPSADRTPEWWWCLEREVYRLASTMGDPDAPRGSWPSFEGDAHSVDRRCHFVHVALATVPFTLDYYAKLGVPGEVVMASLADLARHMAIHRRVYGSTGVDAAWWVTLCLRGEIQDLGCLQYNRFTLGVGDESPAWFDDAVAERLGPGFRTGDPCLGIHIPDQTPLEPEQVEASLVAAASHFRQYFPTATRRVATCMSWLLDGQLAEYLPAQSNIVRFQQRFELIPASHEGDGSLLQFVFRVTGDKPDLDALPQNTTLERAAVAHMRSGRHWRVRTGWLDLPEG